MVAGGGMRASEMRVVAGTVVMDVVTSTWETREVLMSALARA